MSQRQVTNELPNHLLKAQAKERQRAGSIAGGKEAKQIADAFARSLIPTLNEIRDDGIKGRTNIAAALRGRGVPTARGGQWTTGRVSDLFGRLAVLELNAVYGKH